MFFLYSWFLHSHWMAVSWLYVFISLDVFSTSSWSSASTVFDAISHSVFFSSYLLLMNSYTYWNELTIAYSKTSLLLSLFFSLYLTISLSCADWSPLLRTSHSFYRIFVLFVERCFFPLSSSLLFHLIFIMASHIWMRTAAFCLLFTRIDYQYSIYFVSIHFYSFPLSLSLNFHRSFVCSLTLSNPAVHLNPLHCCYCYNSFSNSSSWILLLFEEMLVRIICALFFRSSLLAFCRWLFLNDSMHEGDNFFCKSFAKNWKTIHFFLSLLSFTSKRKRQQKQQ